MFDISFFELLTVAIVALLVVRPEDLPGLLRSVGRGFGKLKEISNEWSGLLDDVSRGTSEEINQIVGDDGQLYDAYDVADLEDLLAVKVDSPRISEGENSGNDAVVSEGKNTGNDAVVSDGRKPGNDGDVSGVAP